MFKDIITKNIAKKISEAKKKEKIKVGGFVLANKKVNDLETGEATYPRKSGKFKGCSIGRDKDGYFRYLLDATQDKNERAEQNQKFNTQSDIWDKAYQTKKYQVAYQNQLQTLWVTIAYPLVMDNKVVAVLGADFTYGIYDRIMYTLKPMEKIFLYIAFFMLIMLILAYILTYLYYKIRKKAIIDPLTQVYNRQYLPEFLETTSLKDFYLMMIDLDKFKLINDNYGHDTGDEVLIAVVSELKSKIRQKDILIRFGGEEFLLFVFKKDLHDCFHVADRLRESIEKLTIKTKRKWHTNSRSLP